MNSTLIFCILVSISLVQSAFILPPSAKHGQNHFESLYRDLVGKNNKEKIRLLNSQSSKFKLAENQFINLSEDQFAALYLGARIPNKTSTSVITVESPVTQFSIDYSSKTAYGGGDYSFGGNIFGGSIISTEYLDIDWNRDGKLTSVKDQGKCGSCWAFTAISDLQTSLIMKGHPKTIDLSEQQLIDCSGNFGNTGCSGGWAVNAFNYMSKYPINMESNYPYVGSAKSCTPKVGSFSVKDLKAYQNNTNCQTLLEIVKLRPLTVAVAADPLFWAFYKSGILDRCPGEINHAVVLAGVKADPIENYWIIKNSWGYAWGENGFMKIDRSQNNGNTCKICSYPAYSNAL